MAGWFEIGFTIIEKIVRFQGEKFAGEQCSTVSKKMSILPLLPVAATKP